MIMQGGLPPILLRETSLMGGNPVAALLVYIGNILRANLVHRPSRESQRRKLLCQPSIRSRSAVLKRLLFPGCDSWGLLILEAKEVEMPRMAADF